MEFNATFKNISVMSWGLDTETTLMLYTRSHTHYLYKKKKCEGVFWITKNLATKCIYKTLIYNCMVHLMTLITQIWCEY
jgi:hypothetical protein